MFASKFGPISPSLLYPSSYKFGSRFWNARRAEALGIATAMFVFLSDDSGTAGGSIFVTLVEAALGDIHDASNVLDLDYKVQVGHSMV